jgi:hypothetical protein
MADMFDKEELNIIGGLFPNTLAIANAEKQALQDVSYKRFSNAAGPQNPFGGLAGLQGMFGTAAGQELQGVMGSKSPLTQVASLREQAAQQFDTNTPDGLMQMAQFLNKSGDAAGARQAILLAQGQQQAGATLAKTQAEEQKALREPSKNAMTQLIAAGKYTPASIAAYQQSQNPADLVLAKGALGEGVGGAGPVGKSGAYRDEDGTIYSASEMAKQRAGFQALEKLADNLNAIKPEDVKNAESFFDYTSGNVSKQVGGVVSPKTVAAQAKVNAAQLLKQIESLPPGSASNADMASAKSSFPGFSNAQNLNDWILDTKTKLSNSMQRQSNQYGFKPQVTITGLEPTAGTTNPNQAAMDWLKANPDDPRAPAIKKKLGL